MSIFLTLFTYWIVPVLFLGACLIFLLRRRWNWRRAGLYGLSAFVSFLLLGAYSILQSRSSTAGIGFLFLPIMALVPGGLGFLLGKIHTDYLERRREDSPAWMHRIAMIVLSVLIAAPFIWQAKALNDTVAKNKARDIEHARQSEIIKKNYKELAALLAQNPGREAEVLRQKMRAAKDRTELLPIADNRFATPEMLEELSRSNVLGVVLTVVRNRNTSVNTLERVYKTHTYPFYFYVALSANPKTPDYILRELYENRHKNGGIALRMAKNPKLPKDLMDRLTDEPNKYVLRNILDRPDTTCTQVARVIETIGRLEDRNSGWLMDKAEKKARSCIQP